MRKKTQLTITLPNDVVEVVDGRRGQISRSLYIELALRQGLDDIDKNGLILVRGPK
jgi:metal-responsive CopG/Arc/MetJ family transcriptional regulator